MTETAPGPDTAVIAEPVRAARGERVYVRAPKARFALHQLEMVLRGVTPAPRLMYDSTNLFAIPLSAPMVASYLTGFPQPPAAWNRFAGKPEIKIVQHPGVYTEGDVLDVENGAATFNDVYNFISQRKAQGYARPTIYCSLDSVPTIRIVTKEFKLGVDYDLWVAHWTGAPHLAYPGSIGTQYASQRLWDLSVIYDAEWPHRTAVPVPPQHGPGPFRQVASGKHSLDHVVANRNTTTAHIAEVTAESAELKDLLSFVTYLLQGADRSEVLNALAALVNDGSATNKVMKKGTVYYTSNF